MPVSARKDQPFEAGAVAAQDLKRRPFCFRHIQCTTQADDGHVLRGFLIEAHRTTAARQSREQFHALPDMPHHGDIAIELARRLTHPSFEIEREYAVRVLGEMTDEILHSLRRGVKLETIGVAAAAPTPATSDPFACSS